MLLHEIIAFATAADRDALALVAGEERFTFGDLWGHIHGLARYVAAVTQPGDRVLILSENTPAMVAALYAVPLAGAIATFANTRHTIDEIVSLTDATDPRLILISAHSDATLGSELRDRLAAHAPTVEVALLDSCYEADEPESTDSPLEAQRARPADCAWLIHTSGTTGRPKGVMLSHRSLLAATLNTALGRPLADDDVYLMPFPLFHVAAYNVLHAHLRRRPVVLMTGFDATEALALIKAESVTVCSLAPTMLAMLLDHPTRNVNDLAHLRQISYGASAMPRDLLLRVSEELPDCGLAQGYGMTELSGNAVFLSAADHRRAVSTQPGLLAAAGRPGPLVELRIADDAGAALPTGSTGEILVRGDQVCSGYWNAPEETARTIAQGWLRTGDIGRIDHDGYLYVVDRKKDIIITGGENVASREVEDLLSTHPRVTAVAVIGLPDVRWGELVTAVVVTERPRPSADDLIEWTRGRIAGFKRPRRVIFVDSLPLNASGKVDKALLRSRHSPSQRPAEGDVPG